MQPNENKTEVKQQKKAKNRRTTILIISAIIASFLLVVFALSWQDSYTLLAYCNAFYFSGFILFFFAWMVLMVNKNVLSPLVYGLKSFFLMFAGKKPAQDYYTYTQDKEAHPIHKAYIYVPLLIALPHVITAIILNILLP